MQMSSQILRLWFLILVYIYSVFIMVETGYLAQHVKYLLLLYCQAQVWVQAPAPTDPQVD